MNTPLAYAPRDASRRLGVGLTTLYKLIAEKIIKPIKIGRRTLIPDTELQRIVDGLGAKGGGR